MKAVNDVINGKYGTGSSRMKALKKAGYDSSRIQSFVNDELKGKKISEISSSKNNDKIKDIVNKVIKGNYGNGEARKKALKKAGYDYNKVQNEVNIKLLGKKAAERIYKRKMKAAKVTTNKTTKTKKSDSKKLK